MVLELLTLEEVANYLRVTEKTIYRLIEKKRIPATRVGHQWRFDIASIDTWLRESSNKNSHSILVIDDDDEICGLFKDVLEDAGYRVTTVNNSNEALELIKKHDYNLVFLDLMLPGMDGADLLGHIRTIKPEIPVTMITGYPESDLLAKALNHGPLGVIKKPFSAATALIATRNHLRLSRPS